MIDVPRDDLVLMLETGYIYLAMGKFVQAREVFEGISALAPKHEVPVVAQGLVMFAQKKFLPAIRLLKEAVGLNPQSAFANAHLGEAYLFSGKKEEARKFLEKASNLEPSGKAGEFARGLKQLMEKGFDPIKLKITSPKKKAS